MNYGYFDDQNREYVITRPDTPSPWINYLGNGGFSGIVSNTGGGLCFDGDPSFRRVTRYKFNNLPKDRPGRYLYIRDEDTGEYWSATWQPVMKEPEFYECRHGLGYTVITTRYSGIETEITYLIPKGKNYELWLVKCRNLSGRPRRLKLFSYVEFSWNDAKYDMLCDWPRMALMADFDGGKIVVDTVAEQLTGTPMYDYIAANLPVDGYDCSLEAFIGPYRSETNPAGVENGRCSNSCMHSDNCVGVLSSSLLLKAEETADFCYTLGAVKDKAAIDGAVADAFSEPVQKNALAEIKREWITYTDHFILDCPDADMNRFINIWNAYQAKTTFDWSRFISLYERGVDRGFGFRDSMQDVLGVIHAVPEKAKERIKLLLSIQLSEGDAKTVYFPSNGSSTGGGRSDDHLWSVFSVCSYLKETGDYGFLTETVPYADGGEGSVLEHIMKAVTYSRSHLGRHGICDIRRCDWNDSLTAISRGGGAESVFVFFQLAHAAYELKTLFSHLGMQEEYGTADEIYGYCQSKFMELWDGRWFIRAYTTKGEKFGTDEDEWNKIFLNPQSWSIISRLPDRDTANTAADSVMKYLFTDKGLMAHFPASSGFDWDNKSYFLYTAGARENGGIFFHSNTWAVIALCLLGRSADAWRCYKASLPGGRNDIADICLTEPYVYSQTMLAPPHDRAGACSNSWLTGTASWMYTAATQYILGIRPEHDGLLIDPCIPGEWKGFRVKRLCRGCTCDISVKHSKQKGLAVNGRPLDGKTVPWELFDGSQLKIELGI